MSGGVKYFISEARICQGELNISYQGSEYVRGGLNISYQGPEYVRGLNYFISGARLFQGA